MKRFAGVGTADAILLPFTTAQRRHGSVVVQRFIERSGVPGPALRQS